MDDIEFLLDLNGIIFPMDNGYWVKYEAIRVEKSTQMPYGIKYSLTLHNRNNQRVIGYDNAHSFKPRNAKYGAKKETLDHIHKKMEVFPYEFDSASQLMEDFWKSVDYYIDQI